MTTTERSPALPDVPTVAETVPGYEASAWFGIGAPEEDARRADRAPQQGGQRILEDPAMIKRLADLGGAPLQLSPAEFGQVIADETEKWKKVVEFSGAKLD